MDASRNILWAIRGRWVRNPPLPAETAKVLFVCQANRCRSPFAELLLAQRLAVAGLSKIHCASAGLNAEIGAPAPPSAIRAARAEGVALESHHARLLTSDIIHDGKGQLLIAMEPSQIFELRQRWPGLDRRLYLLPLFASDESVGAFERYHIVDPYGRGPEAFTHCYTRIAAAISGLVLALTAACASTGPPREPGTLGASGRAAGDGQAPKMPAANGGSR